MNLVVVWNLGDMPTWRYRFMCRAAQISARHGGEGQAKRGECGKTLRLLQVGEECNTATRT